MKLWVEGASRGMNGFLMDRYSIGAGNSVLFEQSDAAPFPPTLIYFFRLVWRVSLLSMHGVMISASDLGANRPACFSAAIAHKTVRETPSVAPGNKKGGSSSVVERQLPKLNVAGSIPVSRSIKSTTSGRQQKPEHRLNTVSRK
jgi:hypothetical protein